jgi:hypothetical protein
MRSADCIEEGPLSGATPKTFALNEFFSACPEGDLKLATSERLIAA